MCAMVSVQHNGMSFALFGQLPTNLLCLVYGFSQREEASARPIVPTQQSSTCKLVDFAMQSTLLSVCDVRQIHPPGADRSHKPSLSPHQVLPLSAAWTRNPRRLSRS